MCPTNGASHYLGNATKPIYEHDSALKTSLRKEVRQEIRDSMREVLSDSEESGFSPSDCDGTGAD